MLGMGRLMELDSPLPMPLTTPTATELNFLNGLPMAIAICPGPDGGRVGQGEGGYALHFVGVDEEHGEVVGGAGSELSGFDLVAVGQPDQVLVALGYDVFVGEDVAQVVNEEAGAGHFAGDGYAAKLAPDVYFDYGGAGLVEDARYSLFVEEGGAGVLATEE